MQRIEVSKLVAQPTAFCIALVGRVVHLYMYSMQFSTWQAPLKTSKCYFPMLKPLKR
jgi:hypothetical protein